MAIPFELWGQTGYPSAEVAGESHHYKAIRALFGDKKVGVDGAELTTTATLIPEPRNKYDRNAVGVWAGGGLVGYLPREDAAEYVAVLTALTSQGWSPEVSARVWGAEREGSFWASVRLDLGKPHLLVPGNQPPGGEHRMLPHGKAIQVTGEEHHLDVLLSLLCPEGECWAYVTLYEVPHNSRSVVEVRIDGARVGQLSPKMSGDLIPAIKHAADQGTGVAARAIVKGNRIKAEVVVHAARAHELPESWLGPVAAVLPRTHGPIPPPPSGIVFAVPPGWPEPPAGWVPPEGWVPDPGWPVAPEGWRWWRPSWD